MRGLLDDEVSTARDQILYLLAGPLAHFFVCYVMCVNYQYMYSTNFSFFGFVFSLTAFIMVISILSPSVAIANISSAFALLFFMLFAGFLVNTGKVVVWLRWLKYCSLFYYGMHTYTHTYIHTDHNYAHAHTHAHAGKGLWYVYVGEV